MGGRLTIYVVGDGWTDVYGHFDSREKAQAWIDRQYALGHPKCWPLVIEEWPINESRDLLSTKQSA